MSKHCETCICGKRAPVQGTSCYLERGDPKERGPGTITWAEHLLAYATYANRYGTGQSAERLAERGGFGFWELADLLGREPTTWEPRR